MQMTKRRKSFLFQEHQTFEHLTAEPSHLGRGQASTGGTVFTTELFVPVTLEIISLVQFPGEYGLDDSIEPLKSGATENIYI